MSDNLASININDIDTGDERYRISFFTGDISALTLSIKQIGLISPPILRQVGKKYIILSGFCRIKALIQNKISQCQALVVPMDASECDCHIKAIAAKSFKRPLSHAEVICGISHLSVFLNEKEISNLSQAIFNTVLNIKFVKDLLSIAKLPKPALALIHEGLLSIKTARRMIGLSDESIIILLDLFSKIKASSSKQLEIITYLKEISARDDIEPEAIYNDPEMKEILSDQNLSGRDTPPGVKTNLVRTFLYKKRFPVLYKTKQKVQNKISALKLGNTIKITPPENFEGQTYSLTLNAKNSEEFESNLKKINTSFSNETLKQIFKP